MSLARAVLLVVDVGNTQTHFGTFDGDELVEHWRFATVRTSTADELGAALRNLLGLRGLGFGDLDASIVSSTVPQLEPEWLSDGERYLGHEMLAVGPGLKTGMPIRYDNPREIGADRLVNSVAICATATAAPRSAWTSAPRRLRRRLAARRVPRRRDPARASRSASTRSPSAARSCRRSTSPSRAASIGKSTVDAIRAGVIYGYAGAVDGILRRIERELGERGRRRSPPAGCREHIVPFTEHIDEVDDLLTLDRPAPAARAERRLAPARLLPFTACRAS